MERNNLPQWKCHKVVRAAKIERVTVFNSDGDAELHCEGGHVTSVSREWLHGVIRGSELGKDAVIGGYIVQYGDGYASWSPSSAFEAGYTRLPEGLDGLQPHQQRVVIEAAELRDRLEKLTTFIADGAGPIFANLSLEERQDMQIQRISMKDCLMALDSRIARFNA